RAAESEAGEGDGAVRADALRPHRRGIATTQRCRRDLRGGGALGRGARWRRCRRWRTPEARKAPISASIRSIRSWSHALLREPTPLQAFAALDMPILYMTGKKSPASARGVAKILTRVLPRVEVIEFDGLGHMAPVTHPDAVNAAVSRFLQAN